MKRGTSSGPRKVQYGSVPLFIACCFTLAFTLGYITFYNFLKHYSALMEKKKFCKKIFISNGFTQTPHPINGHNPQSMMKFFCQRYLNYDH